MEGLLAGEARSLVGNVGYTASRAAVPSPDTEFDAVFVINLDRDANRLAHTGSMLERHGVPFERFAATDGSTSENVKAWQDYQDEGPQLPPERYTGQRLIESPGAWGYLKTMEALIQEARRRGVHRMLIFDDDVMLRRDFQKRFADAWAELPDDWRLIYLGTASADPSKVIRFSDHLYHPGSMANGSYAIALDASVFDQALASIRRFDWPFDAGALREIDAAYPDRVFAVDPPLVVANVADSSIRPGRAMDAHAAKHGWDLSDYEEPLGPS
jgi:GR25 family glycosyltransferase involved in LPS biosynthesis